VHRLEGLHGDKPLKSPLFRTNYYTIVLISEGKASYTIDGHTYALQRLAFYFTIPGHLKSFDIQELLSGFMITFSEKFVKQFFSGDFFQQFPFLVQETIPVMYLSEDIFEDIATICAQMQKEYERKSTFKNAVLTNLLSVLLFKIKELLPAYQAQNISRQEEIVLAFKHLLNENFVNLASSKSSKLWSVKEYADKLHLHPNYLSNLIKETTQKSPSEWIQERTLAEAQSLLLNTTKTVSEIAYSLGFTDTAHFGKFIKKYTGMTALELRSQSLGVIKN
jgi:AraC family transcriptional regulator, transcriptional activator of pobA